MRYVLLPFFFHYLVEYNAELANSGAYAKAKGTKLKQVYIVKWLWRFLLCNLTSLNGNISEDQIFLEIFYLIS